MLRVTRVRAAVASCTAALIFSAALVTGMPASAANPRPPGPPPKITGFPPVTTPPVPAGRPLPHKSGSVPVNRALRVAPPVPSSAPTSPRGTASPPGSATAVPNTSTTATTAGSRVALRALVIAIDSSDYGLPTWRTTLDRVGAAYDVLLARDATLTTASLIRADGTGRYDAILLTNSNMLYLNNGSYVSALDTTEWNTLWAYERDYSVRQAVLYGSYGTYPEDYCLQGVSEGSVGDTPLNVSLSSTGAGIIDYLKATARIPLVQSYVYQNSVKAGCAATPIVTAGSNVLGVVSTSTDGRERIELTFTNNQYLLQSDLLVYGLFRWASHGLFLGEQRHYINVDVDDWFNTSDEYLPDGTINTDPGWQMSAHDAYNAYLKQLSVRQTYPLANSFTFGMAYNGGDADLSAGTTCYPNGGVNQLTSTTRCLATKFRWINHSANHVEMNFTDYATNYSEITSNLTIAQQLGLPVNRTVFKSPSYSGLGVYNPDPNDSIDPPTDYGLTASNTAMLEAAKDAGVKYLHGNMSFPSEVPSCFDCGIVHPLEPALMVVPDWPTNIAYFATTPQEETAFYNAYYGPNGKFPYWPTNQTYSQIISYETDIALTHMTSGSVYTHTFHIGNLRDYGSGQTLLGDWLTALLAKYSSYYSVPALNPGWPSIAQYAALRNGHFAELNGGVDAVFDRSANTVTVTSPLSGKITVSGARTAGFTTYGTDSSATITLTAGTPVVFTPSLRP